MLSRGRCSVVWSQHKLCDAARTVRKTWDVVEPTNLEESPSEASMQRKQVPLDAVAFGCLACAGLREVGTGTPAYVCT